MKKTLLGLALLAGLSTDTKAEEILNAGLTSDSPKTEQRSDSTVSVCGSYQGVNFEVDRKTHKVSFPSLDDKKKFSTLVEDFAARRQMPVKVAKDIAERLAAVQIIKKYADPKQTQFAASDEEFAKQLTKDAQYIKTHGAQAFYDNIMSKKSTTVDFEQARQNLVHNKTYRASPSVSYQVSGKGEVVILDARPDGRVIQSLMPHYERENSDKVSKYGIYIAYKDDKGMYHCGGSIARTANAAHLAETAALNNLYVTDVIASHIASRQAQGEVLTSGEEAVLRLNAQLLKKHGIMHDKNGSLIRTPQNTSKSRHKTQSY
ncbi:MAG: hypothetical protein IJ689_08015 [Alphaproteobacteria bacterium]|nr:hypothetical protein [Alphaproteobacteria bacterium]MBR1649520.1 hypothetical protein [Alphaproteobacteria bacterium]